jgi:WD40 repeat protein
MYWPSGVPHVYAYKRRKHQSQPDDQRHLYAPADENAATNEDTNSTPGGPESKAGDLDAHGGIAPLIALQTSRSDNIFATLTRADLDVWFTRPTVVLSSVHRSESSLKSYGENVDLCFKPDASILVVRTANGYLLTYSIDHEPNERVYQQHLEQSQARRQSIARHFGIDSASGLPELSVRLRRAIKIDAGLTGVLALENELVVSTSKPAAIQCIKWEADPKATHTSAQLLSKLEWIVPKTTIISMVHDRAMNLSVWVGSDGSAYAVQRVKTVARQQTSSDESLVSSASSTAATKLFEGFKFHTSEVKGKHASRAAINARFSVIAIASQDAQIVCYAAKDYTGNIPLSHTLRAPALQSTTGDVTCMTWSPDGYCLFVGFEKGWATWSVFGKEGASSFTLNTAHAEANDENWLVGTGSANWTSGGSEMLLTSRKDYRVWKLQMSRSAAVGCFSCANLVRALLQTPTELTIYRGHEMPDLTSISNDASLWHHAQYPAGYLQSQAPIKSSVVSQDGRYIAVAGRRGLAHYSLQSQRWNVFDDGNVENSFAVRGGMCWFHHVLAVGTEHVNGYDLRLYSRELDLGKTPLSTEAFTMPIVFIGPSGEDSLLVYTYENILYHYVLNISGRGAQLVQVGQIAFHGVVRAPSRVRSVSWVLPDRQMRSGDPSRDVEFASVLFLVDDKLVLLQPSRTPEDELKYDMRVIAQHVEYYILMRDQIYFNFTSAGDESVPPTPSPGGMLNSSQSRAQHLLRDSLWIFTGDHLRTWTDVRDVLQTASDGNISADLPLLSIPVDFYPLSILLTKGVVLGIESELLQRRDVSFAQYRSAIRTHLFIPYILRQQLCDEQDTASALSLANQYDYLSYFPHTLEILLHHVLDDEVDARPVKPNSKEVAKSIPDSPLPTVLSFLQTVLSLSQYLSTIVQCIRKTEVTSWRTLFAHLPEPHTLFEEALALEDLKTASGYLIVLQGLDEEEDEEPDIQTLEGYVVTLLKLARQKNDFELCSELARFMIAIDPRGNALRRVINEAGFRGAQGELKEERLKPQLGLGLSIPKMGPVETRSRDASPGSGGDYFSASPGS